MRYLQFDLSDGDEGITTIEALASTAEAHRAAVEAEAQQVLAWAWQHFPDTHGAVEDGADWDHDLQLQVEAGGWHSLSLTLTASPRFQAAFERAWMNHAD